MGIERPLLVRFVVGNLNLAHALVEFMGNFWLMVARWKGLEARGWLRWIEKDDAVLVSHFLWKSGRFLLCLQLQRCSSRSL